MKFQHKYHPTKQLFSIPLFSLLNVFIHSFTVGIFKLLQTTCSSVGQSQRLPWFKKKGTRPRRHKFEKLYRRSFQVSHSNIRRWGTWFLLPIITPFMTFLAPGSFYPTWDQIFSTYNYHHTRNNGISSKYPLSEGGSIVPTCLSDIQDWKQLMIAYHD